MASDQSLVWGSVFPAVLSSGAAAVSVVYGRRASRQERLDGADDLARRFREPLLQSASNLQSRLYNIVRQDFLTRFGSGLNATSREREYAVLSTAFLLAQYLGWVEIIRRESLHLDPRDRAQNRAIAERLEAARNTLADSDNFDSSVLRIFRGEQRAIGEVMLQRVSDQPPGAPRWECLGYAAFVREAAAGHLSPWITLLERDVETLAQEPGKHDERVVALQHDLIDLIDVLDPARERVAAGLRNRLQR